MDTHTDRGRAKPIPSGGTRSFLSFFLFFLSSSRLPSFLPNKYVSHISNVVPCSLSVPPVVYLFQQFSAKHEQKLDCGGGYIKLLPSTSDMKSFGGETPYSIMFGPDICGYSTKRVHAIFTYNGKNLLTKKTIPCETDELTHVYTLVVHPNNTYAVLIDNEVKESGDLEDHWDFLPPKTIKDPEAKKPDDWDERAMIPDENDVKPEGYDDIPETITDPEAKKPEDWDDEDDGEWEAPTIPNPEFKGPWTQKEIDNPDYKGIWEAPDIPNPDYKADPTLYKFDDLRYVGFELWQVKAGTIFDNILVTDDVDYAKKFAEDTWGKNKVGGENGANLIHRSTTHTA